MRERVRHEIESRNLTIYSPVRLANEFDSAARRWNRIFEHCHNPRNSVILSASLLLRRLHRATSINLLQDLLSPPDRIRNGADGSRNTIAR